MVSKNILLIEDDKDLLELFVDALIGNGYSVDGFADPPAFEVSEFESEMRELELSNFMKKPIHIEQLLNVVKLCLEKKKA